MTITFTSYQADLAIEESAKVARATTGVAFSWGVTNFDNWGTPPLAGWVYTFGARSGHMKSTLMNYLNRTFGKQLQTINQNDPNVLNVGAWVKVEEVIEQARFGIWENVGFHYADLFSAKIPIAQIIDHRKNQEKLPIIYVGKSATNGKFSATQAFDNARLSTLQIAECLTRLRNGDIYQAGQKQIRPAYLVIDYLQKLDPKTKGRYTNTERIEAVSADIMDIATAFQVPVILAAQTSMKDADGGIPDETEIFGSSQAAMDTFAFVGLMRPIKNKTSVEATNIRVAPKGLPSSWDGDSVKVRGDDQCYPMTTDMLIMRVNKWRNTRKLEGKTFPVWFDDESHLSEISPYGSKPKK